MTAQPDLGVRVITAYSNQRVGRIIFPPALLRDQLIKQGFVEPVRADSDQLPLDRPSVSVGKARSGKMPAAVTR